MDTHCQLVCPFDSCEPWIHCRLLCRAFSVWHLLAEALCCLQLLSCRVARSFALRTSADPVVPRLPSAC